MKSWTSSRAIAPTLLCIFSATFIACRTTAPTPVVKRPDGSVVKAPPKASSDDESKARVIANEAAQLNESERRAKLEALQQEYPSTLAAAELYVKKGQDEEAAGNTKAAIDAYEKLLFYRPSFPKVDAVRNRYGRLLLKVGRYEDAAAMLAAQFDTMPAGDDRTQLGLDLADALLSVKKGESAIEVLSKLHKNAGTQERQVIQDRAENTIRSGFDFAGIERAYQQHKDDKAWAFALPALTFKLAKVYVHVRNNDAAKPLLNAVVTNFPNSKFRARASSVLQSIAAREKVDPNKVGVLLPLSGRYKPFGERAKIAIELAFKKSAVQLIFKDTEGEEVTTAQALKSLIEEHAVIAIIGPIFSRTSRAAALITDDWGVPMISLSFTEGLPDMGDYVFQAALTVKAQAEALAKVAFEDMGMSRFALFYPQNSYGRAFLNAFWDQVDARKGLVTAVETYSTEAKNFTQPARKLVGRHWLWARGDYRNKIKQLQAQNLPSHRYRAAIEKVQKSLPPITDFDAIVIPDTGKSLGLLTPALAVEDIVTEKDPKQLVKIAKALGRKDLKPVTLMGGSTWNKKSALESCGRYCEGSVFVDGFFGDATAPHVRDFVDAFNEKAARTPYRSDAEAFDAASLVKSVLEKNKPASREAFRQALLSIQAHTGVTGSIKFDESGEAKRTLYTLTFEEEAIKLWTLPSPANDG